MLRSTVPCMRLVVASLALGSLGACVAADPPAVSEAPLGRVTFDPGCDPAVRVRFDRALALLHHMTYPAAYAGFEQVVEDDPSCALASWGMAMTLFQPLWPNRPTQANLEEGRALVRRARAASSGDGIEDLMVRTGEAFFDPPGSPDYWDRIRAWGDATTALHGAYPDEIETKALQALATLATASLDGDAAASHARAATLLDEILSVEPTHPGAVHYTIHANDFAGRASLSLDVVRRYGDIAPANPHALHMPTHIFVRLGSWDEVVDWNLRAADAALAQPTGPDGNWVWDEYPHAVEYLVYAYLQQGRDEDARRAIERMRATPNLEPTFKTAFHLTSTAARVALERGAWAEALALEVRPSDRLDWDGYPWPDALTWYARGLGAAHLGQEALANESLDRLVTLRERARANGELVFVAPIEIMRLELAAWIAAEAGDAERAMSGMRQAVELEATTPKHPVTPGATLPAAELLGDLSMRLGRVEDAVEAYRLSGERAPGRLNTRVGLARAYERLGETELAVAAYRTLLEGVWSESSRPAVEEARRAVAESGRD